MFPPFGRYQFDRILLAAAFAGCLGAAATLPGLDAALFEEKITEIGQLQESGEFTAADEAVNALLVDKEANLTTEQARALEYELERSRRIQLDYQVGEERLVEILSERIRDFKAEELAVWEEMGRLDYKVIDGEKLYVGPSASNLLFRYDDIDARRLKPRSFEWHNFLFEHIKKVKEEANSNGQGLADPRSFLIEMTITVKPDVIPAGQTIQCWMPYPQQFQAQSGIKLLQSSPEVSWINAPDYPTRSLYFEQPSQGEEPTVFQASYTLTTYPRSFDIDPALVANADQTANPYHEYFTREQAPHAVFTPELVRLADEICGDETNPAVKARLIFDYVCKNYKYSYAREYSTLRCIPEYVLENGYGDCGQIALLYITLCRIAGIPARWQSGWVIYPQWENLHDWTEIYLAPYGWVPVDPDYGMEVHDSFDNLTDEEREEMRLFYFGGLEAYRIAVNREHGYPHYPAKKDFRSDNVDFQRGELESNGRNIYFPDFRYNLEAEELETPAAADVTDISKKDSEAPTYYPGAAR